MNPVIALAWRIKQPEDRKQRRFAATRRSSDGNEFAVLNFQVHVAQRVCLDFVRVKHFGHAFEAYQSLCRRVHLPSSDSTRNQEIPVATAISRGRSCPTPTCPTE